MSYCPECGSEVANNDIFCAYCGISLQVMTEQPPVSETSQPENSPILGEPEKIQTSASLDKEPISNEPAESQFDDSVPVTPPTPFILEEKAEAVSEQKNDAIEESRLQELSNELTKTAEQVVEKTGDFSVPPENYGIGEINSEITESQSVSEDPASDLQSSEMQFNRENTESSSVNESVNPPVVDEFSQTIPYTPADYVNQDLPLPETTEPSPDDVEDRLKSVLDEIDFNFQSGKLNQQSPAEEEVQSAEEAIAVEDTVPSENPIEAQTKTEEKTAEYEYSDEIVPEKSIEAETPVINEPQETPVVEQFDSEEANSTAISADVPVSAELQPIAETAGDKESAVQETPFSEAISTPVIEPAAENPASEIALEMPGSGELPATHFVEENPSAELELNPPVFETPAVNVPAFGTVAEPPKEEAAIVAEAPETNIDSEDKEARSFTNPNIGYGDTDGRSKQKLKPLEEGTVLNNRYEVIRKIGGGGMGAVYLANDKNLGGVLRAVKEMVQSYIEDEQQEKAVNDFKRESLLLTSLEHAGIPTIYDYFFDEKEGRFYLVMKYISGGDLAARLRSAPEGRIDEVTVTDWAIQVADVLDYLHNRQPPIVYRDLKPSNVMIDGNTGKLMIIDFGIARWVNKEEKGVTAVGTMGYAPPELFSGNVEPRSDIYSLGSTMFHLLTGADPQSNPLLIFDFNKNPRPRQINPSLSDQMEQILMRSVEYNSEQRFGSAAEMREELLRHLDNLKKGTVTFGVVSSVKAGQSLSSVPVFCGFCGQKIVATDMFCPFCGAQQPLVGQSQKLQQPPSAYVPVQNITARLLVVGTHDLEQTEYPLEKESNLLGRRDPMSNIFPEVDMSKFDPQTKISRKHAKIWRDGEMFMLEDLGSSNGTILIMNNNESIRLLPHQPHVLSHGDKLKLGDTTLRFTIG